MNWLSPYRWIALLSVLVGLTLGYGAWAKHQQGIGYQKAAAEYAAQAIKTDRQREAIAAPIAEKQQAAQAQIRTVTQTLVKKVNIYVPSDACPLPGGFRLLTNAAAANVEISDTAAVLDDSAVPAATAAETVIANYGIANSNAERLSGLQAWVRAQEALK